MNNLEKIENQNDRYNIVLLKLKPNKTQREIKRLKILVDAYPDNEAFEGAILHQLYDRGMISETNSEIFQDENGFDAYKYPDLPKDNYTNEIGEKALKNNLFPSEFRQKSLNKRFRNLQAVGITIAAIGGLITIFTFLYKLIQCCPK